MKTRYGSNTGTSSMFTYGSNTVETVDTVWELCARLGQDHEIRQLAASSNTTWRVELELLDSNTQLVAHTVLVYAKPNRETNPSALSHVCKF